MRSLYLTTFAIATADLAADIMKEWKQKAHQIEGRFQVNTQPVLKIDDDRLERLAEKLRSTQPIVLPPITV
jgi:hypothetical protein